MKGHHLEELKEIEMTPHPIADLPSGPPGRSGWPWTAARVSSFPARMPEGSLWPSISIVTPSFNQGPFLEETIRSILLQGYPHLEYIVIDGGSTDETPDVLKKYEAWLTYWVSEPDQGQAAAINKGLRRATGQIVAFLNSDDTYQPDTLATVAGAFMSQPRLRWLCGRCAYVDEHGKELSIQQPKIPRSPAEWILRPLGLVDYAFPQPAVFLRNEFRLELGPFREDYAYCFDHDYWLRALLTGHGPSALDYHLANFRVHPGSKTGSLTHGFQAEDLAIADRYSDRLRSRERKQLLRFRGLLQTMAIVTDCAALAETQGAKAARRKLWGKVRENPALLSYRAVWGAFRRWYGIHPEAGPA